MDANKLDWHFPWPPVGSINFKGLASALIPYEGMVVELKDFVGGFRYRLGIAKFKDIDFPTWKTVWQ